MDEQGALGIFTKLGVIIADRHIVYTSGRHGSVYVDKDILYQHVTVISDLCSTIADSFINDYVQVVVAPEKGGIILAQWVAYHLCWMGNYGQEVIAFYAEKANDGSFVFRRGRAASLISGKRVLVVDDVLTTGGSAKKVIEATRALGGNVIGLGVICNRGEVTMEDVANPPKLFVLLNLKLNSWDEADCPLCAQGVPINTEVGKGREFWPAKE